MWDSVQKRFICQTCSFGFGVYYNSSVKTYQCVLAESVVKEHILAVAAEEPYEVTHGGGCLRFSDGECEVFESTYHRPQIAKLGQSNCIHETLSQDDFDFELFSICPQNVTRASIFNKQIDRNCEVQYTTDTCAQCRWNSNRTDDWKNCSVEKTKPGQLCM